MTNKTSTRCAKTILFFYGISFLLSFLVGVSNFIPAHFYIICFTPCFAALCGFTLFLGRKKVVKSLNDSILFSFAPIAMFNPIHDLLNKALNITETISNTDKSLMLFYLIIAICSILKALISFNELYKNLTDIE
ncbi:TPA: hypothetical protein RJR47_003157 [Klebsiella michiganensis]|nr:hypothetical protein [Klebsiella michiganensis]